MRATVDTVMASATGQSETIQTYLANAPGADVLRRVARHRVARVQQEIARRGVAAVLLYNPINIRYATGTRNMQVWHLHNPLRHALVLAGGPTILFEYPGAAHLHTGADVLVDEIRPPTIHLYMCTTSRQDEFLRAWAREIADTVVAHGGAGARLAVDRLDPPAAFALVGTGLSLVDGQGLMEQARAIKSHDEISVVRHAVRGTELALERMRRGINPGRSEQAIWSDFLQTGIEVGGEWADTRLLASGQRTNPWFQECGERVVQAGELLAFDTDFVGPGGYFVDISRTWLCGDVRPSARQRRLYADAYEALQRQLSLLEAGITFEDYARRVGPVVGRYAANRYTLLAHGLGMAEEYPVVPFEQDLGSIHCEGVFEDGMTVCIEYYAGEEGGADGVKLEEQVVVRPGGYERLSTFPYELDWL